MQPEEEMMKITFPLISVALAILVAASTATAVENPFGFRQPYSNVNITSRHETQPLVYTMRQELIDSFERADLTPWTTEGDTLNIIFGIRDTTNTYGPDTCAVSGYRYPGHPDTDVAVYPSPGVNPGHLVHLISPTIDVTGWDSLFLSFAYWGDFEGAATNFDGGLVEISNDNGTTWAQIDTGAVGHLNPTYDARLAGTGHLGNPYAYCYDTDGWVKVSSQELFTLGYAAAGDQVRIRFTFDYDALEGGQGWFIDDVYIGEIRPPDFQSPVIDHTPLTDTEDTLNNYTVSATVTDVGSGVDPDSVILHYEIEDGPTADVFMTNVSGDDYEADIPAQTYHTDIWYQIIATDLVGNTATTPLYNFEVTNAKTIAYDDGQPWYGPTVTTPGTGPFVQFMFNAVGIDSGLLHQVKIFFEEAGNYDLRIYRGTAANPGELLDSLAGLVSTGYEWQTIDITDLDIQMTGSAVVGFVIGPPIGDDTAGVLSDSTLDYTNNMWQYSFGTWAHATTGGDFMIRLKVIPIPLPGVQETPEEVSVFTLRQISSNPTRNNAVIEYQLPTAQKVTINVYDVTGQVIMTLVDADVQAGVHRITWDGRDNRGIQAASGVYFLKCEAGEYTATQKLMLIR
jgi:hypothetical protein